MDRLGFKHCNASESENYWFEVQINGKSLEDLFRPAFVAAGIEPFGAFSADCSLVPFDMFYRCGREADHVVEDFLARAKCHAWFLTAFDRGVLDRGGSFRLILSICGCGEWGCGWTSARVKIAGQTIRWSEFNYSEKHDFDLPELVFERAQYLEAIKQVFHTMGSDQRF